MNKPIAGNQAQSDQDDRSCVCLAEIVLPAIDLKTELPFFLDTLCFRLEEIFPADDPAVAVISGYAIRIRLDRNLQAAPGKLRLRCTLPTDFAQSEMVLLSPSGNLIEVIDRQVTLATPQTQHSYQVRHLTDTDSWIIGRAGMHYRDLIPTRLGGSIIASHIRIPEGGPVPDMVHYHTVGFQLIFCYRGWVKLVYEDQGEPFVLEAGNCVIQPPQIRHRVLESSDQLEVLEIGVPAEHITTIDHEMTLPTNSVDPDRLWQGTRFVHFKDSDIEWQDWRIAGWQSKDTGIEAATDGVASVHICRPANNTVDGASNKGSVQSLWTTHDTDILFTFVKEGEMTLQARDKAPCRVGAGDAFVVPPFLPTRYVEMSKDCELIEVSLPADFTTKADKEV